MTKSPKSNCGNGLDIFLVGIFLIVTAHPTYSQVLIDCAGVKKAVGPIPLTSSAFDWPKSIHIPGAIFPKWTNIDPRDALTMIETNYILHSEAYYTQIEENKYTYMLHGRLPPSVADFKAIWNRSRKSIYDTALSKGLLEYEQTTLSGPFGRTGDIVAFRYRIKDRNPPELQDATTPEMAVMSKYYSWEYVFRLYSEDGSYNDYIVGSDLDPAHGELAVIDKSLVIFNESGWEKRVYFLQVFWKDPDPILVRLHKYYPTLKESGFITPGPSCELSVHPKTY